MKATLQTPSEKQPELKFPLLARSKTDGLVVLFSNPRKGTIMIPGSGSSFPSGHYSECWLDVQNSDNWTILPPGSTVTLEQE